MKLKLIKTLLSFVVFTLATSYAFSQDGFVVSSAKFRVVDAKGNVDTVMFIIKDGATDGIDPELGEINLYGQEPKGDLEMRIIRRTTVNCKDEESTEFWLCPNYEQTSKENLDFKIEYVPFKYNDPRLSKPNPFVIKIHAIHYPISIYISEKMGIQPWLSWAQFNEKDGQYIDGSENSSFILGEQLLCTLEEETENNLLWMQQEHDSHIYSKSTFSQQTIYPNPSKDFITVEEGKIHEKFDIVNVNGKKVHSFRLEFYPCTVYIADLPKGVYYVRNNKGTEIYKFVKE